MDYTLGVDLPSFLAIPEELEARDFSHALDELVDREYYITQKHEGTSVVYVLIDDRFVVYNKREGYVSSEGYTPPEWTAANELLLKRRLQEYYLGQKVALYGVIDPRGDLIVHGVFFIEEQMFATYVQLWAFCNEFGFDMANLVDKGDKFRYSVEDLEAMASKLKHKGKPTPGLVVRSQWPLRSTVLGKEWSLKVTNVNYQKE